MVKNNDLITWNSELTCGINLVDEQHKKLVELINELLLHVTGNEIQEHDYFNNVLDEAVKYFKIHFSTEENIMFVTNFPGYTDHKKEHEKSYLEILDIIHDYEVGGRITLSEFTRRLKDCFVSHLKLIDKQYFLFLKRNGSYKNNGVT